MAKRKSPTDQVKAKSTLPEYGQLVKVMQDETASILTDYIRQYVGMVGSAARPGEGIYMNFDRVLRTQTYQELAWYDLYAEVERDPQVMAVMSSAKLNVASMRWDVSAYVAPKQTKASTRDEEIAAFVADVLRGTGYFPQHLYNLMDALGKGFAVSEIIWDVQADGVRIKNILNRPQRRFQFDAVDRSLKLRDLEQPYYGKPLPDYKFICHRVSSEWENPFGDALDQSLYWMWLFKKTATKFWLQHLEVGASTVPIVRHPAAADDTMKSEALAVAEMIRNGAYGRIPDNFELIWAEATNAVDSANAYQNFIRHCDEQITKCIQGQTLTTEASSASGNGTRALGSIHQQTQDTRDLFRARGIEATLNASLIKWIVDFNFADVDGYPEFRFDLEDPIDLKGEAVIVKTLTDAGYEFDENELSDKFNYTLTKKEPKPIPPALQKAAGLEPAAPNADPKKVEEPVAA